MRARTHADPGTKDGRNVDPALGTLSGEGAQEEVRRPPAEAYPTTPTVEGRRPDLFPTQATPTYYGLPVLKEPVWKGAIALYFYVGGVSGASAALGAAVHLAGTQRLQPLAKRCAWVATAGSALSAALLIEDLGRRARFHHMLRVFRPTSPMSVGTWIVSAFGASSATAALLHGSSAGRTAGVAAGLFGLGMATYTAVLLSNTAVPAWQGAHRELPFIFATGAAAGAASLLELLSDRPEDRRVVRALSIASQSGELLASRALRRTLRKQPEVLRSVEEGVAGALHKTSTWCTAASLLLSLAPGDARWKRRASGWLGTLGAVALRFAIFHAGKSSARRPQATFLPQREGHGAELATGKAAVAGPRDLRATDPQSTLPPRAHGGLL